MGISSFSAINANLGPSYRGNDWLKYRYTEFEGPATYEGYAVIASTPDVTTVVAAPGVAVGDINTIRSGRYAWQNYINIAFAGQAPQVTHNIDGLLLSTDATASDGIEFAPILARVATSVAGVHDGAIVKPSRAIDTFKSQTDDMFVRAKFLVEDVSALDFCGVGFRQSELPVADPTTYTDYFFVNLNNGTAETRNRLNSGTESVQISTETVADAGAVTFEVRVNKAGKARAYVNGAVIATEIAGFTFDSGDLLIPFFFTQQDSADGGAVALQLWEQGTFDQRGLVSLGDLTN